MARNNRNHKNQNHSVRKDKDQPEPHSFLVFPAARGYLIGLVFMLASAIIVFSFFDLAGSGGREIFILSQLFLGKSIFLVPLALILIGCFFFVSSRNFQRLSGLLALGFVSIILGLSAVLSSFNPANQKISFQDGGLGGLAGYLLSFPVINAFGFWINFVIFGGLVVFGFFVFWQLSQKIKPKEAQDLTEKPSLVRKIFEPQLKIKEVPTAEMRLPAKTETPAALPELKTKPILQIMKAGGYKKPPLDLLESDRGSPTTGDIRNNIAIIKKTLETFGIPVEMGEVNVGPTVTQYTLKPAEGIKLSKITTLSNDLSLALAIHPIRIEAPIPGKALVGIELPNKARTQVRLKNLFESPEYKNSFAPLLFALGRDVAGNPSFADLTRMPHMLVAGSTGSGKTICLNTIILGLIFRNSPEILRLILVDPKRVEFPVYEDLPHLLAPVIFDSQKTVNALKWLVKEMERRFEVLAQAKARDIGAYNRDILTRAAKKASDEETAEIMPYIVVIVDELADLMAARGKEVEAGIVRLAQMARAVGIHLIVATQRPSVEVITGLIKANITSRVTFQVASQVDSRTVIDTAGAEKLLGAGDLLYVSSETAKPRRLQGAYVTDKEVRKVVEFLKSGAEAIPVKENFLAEELERELETVPEGGAGQEFFGDQEDPLYLSAKQLVIEAKKASASLLQRRLRVGYARAARLLDILEQRGVVGPADGAKPREIYFKGEENDSNRETEIPIKTNSNQKDGDGWEKV